MPSRFYRIGRSATGLGMFATKPIKRRTYIATYRGPSSRLGSGAAGAARRKIYVRNQPQVDHRRLATLNVGRYLNHSCEPDAQPVLRKGRIVFIALRRIAPGEEITYDYGQEYFEYFLAIGACLCAPCRAKAAVRRSKRRKAARRQK